MEKQYVKWSVKPLWEYWALKMSVHIDNLTEIANEKWYVNIILNPRKEVWQYWDTYSIVVDNWKPEQKENVSSGIKTGTYWKVKKQEEIDITSIPF